MATKTSTSTHDGFGKSQAVSAAIAGFVGVAVMFPLSIWMGLGPQTAVVIPALYGIQGPNLAAAWVIHFVHGTIWAVGYAAVMSNRQRLSEYATAIPTGLVIGFAFGVVLAILGTGTLMLFWLEAVGFPNAPSPPMIRVPTLVTHTAYGIVLGGGYPLLSRKIDG